MQFYLSIKSNKFGTKHFFYTYEYTLDLIFKEFAGYFTILIVVNLIFKTEESWKFEEKKMCGRIVREIDVLIGRLKIRNYGWKTGIMDDRLKLQSKSRKLTEKSNIDWNAQKRRKSTQKRPKSTQKRRKSTQKQRKSIRKPKVDRKAKNWPKC